MKRIIRVLFVFQIVVTGNCWSDPLLSATNDGMQSDIQEVIENPFDTFYIGGGVGYNSLKNETYQRVEWKYVTSGGGLDPAASARGLDQKTNRVAGSFVLGVGVCLGRLYLSLEGLVDIAKQKSEEIKRHPETYAKYDTRGILRNNGLVPELGIRIGFADPIGRVLFYLRPAITFSRTTVVGYSTTLNAVNNKINSEKHVKNIAWAIALGAEKMFPNGLAVRLEGEYLLPSKMVVRGGGVVEGVWLSDGVADTTSPSYLEAKTHGFNVRTLCTYNINY
jgi:opacity protein-like surface antigen